MQKTRIGIFDDHPLIGKGLADYILEADSSMEIIFLCKTKEDLLNQVKLDEPNILILDIVAPDVTGLELFETIASHHPSIKILAYSTLNSAILTENLLSIGVRGFVNKKQDPSEIIKAIHLLLEDKMAIPEEYKFLTSKYRELNHAVLSKREIEILQMIANELTSAEIAEKLFLSLHTVENHRQNIFRKLDVKNLAGLIMTANKLGYIS